MRSTSMKPHSMLHSRPCLAFAAAWLMLTILRTDAASPITFDATSYNVDLIYENVAIGEYTVVTGTQDDDSLPSQSPELQTGGDDRTWPETGLVIRGVTSTGMPANRTVTSGTTTWNLQPYNANNVMQIQNWGRSGPQSRTMILSPQARVPYRNLDVLHAAAPEHVLYTVRLTFVDGTTAELGQNLALQWGTGATPQQVITSHRVSTDITYPSPFPASIQAGYDDGIAAGGAWSIYRQEFDLRAAGLDQKALLSITFTNHSNSNYTVFAVSGTPLAVPASPPTIGVRRVGSLMEVTWDHGVLQQCGAVGGLWVDLPDAVSPHFVDTTGPSPQFFRVRY